MQHGATCSLEELTICIFLVWQTYRYGNEYFGLEKRMIHWTLQDVIMDRMSQDKYKKKVFFFMN